MLCVVNWIPLRICVHSRNTQPQLEVGLGISRMNADSQWNPVYLRWGWVFLDRTQILSGIQFTTHSIEICVVETIRFVCSTVNVILTRQTCGQRSSRAAEIKRQALGNCFSERICYMFLIPKCREDWNLGLCTTSGFLFGESMRSGDFGKKNVFRLRKNLILPLRCGSPKTSPEVVHRPRSQSPPHFGIGNTQQIRSQK